MLRRYAALALLILVGTLYLAPTPASAVAITLPNYGEYGAYLTNPSPADAYLFWFDDSAVGGDVVLSEYHQLGAASDWTAGTDFDTHLYMFDPGVTGAGEGQWYLAFDGMGSTRQYEGLRVEFATVLNGELQDYGTYYRDSRDWYQTEDFTHHDDIAAAVPIPGAVWLLGSGLLGLLGLRRRVTR